MQRRDLIMSDFITKVFEKVIDNFVNSLKMIDTDHVYIHEGKYYSYSEYVTMLTGTSLTIGFLTPETLEDIHIRATIINTSVDSFRMIFQEAPILSSGSDVKANCYNHNRKSTNTTNMQEFKRNMTINTPGTILLPVWLPGGVGIGQTRTGSGNPAQYEWVLKQNTWYALQMINNSSASQILNFTMNWYEEGEL